MFSENFMKGETISVMLQVSFNPGAIFRMSSLSVDITAPDFGSSLEEIVPPVTTKTIFGSFCGCWVASLVGVGSLRLWVSRTVASRISFSLIPMLYPVLSFRRIISGS